MGLPTGVEVKTEPVKSEETVVAATVEEVKPVVTLVENTTAATGTASAETTEAIEVCAYFNVFFSPLSLNVY